MGLLKQKSSTGCDIEVVSRNVVAAKSSMNGSADGLRPKNFLSYASIRHDVDQSLVKVSKHLKGMFEREAATLHRAFLMLFAVPWGLCRGHWSVLLRS